MSTTVKFLHNAVDSSALRERAKVLSTGTRALDSAVAVAFHAVAAAQPGYGPSEVLVFLAVAHVTDHTIASGNPFRGVTQTEVAKWAALSTSTVSRCLRELCAGNWVRALDGKGVQRYALHPELRPGQNPTSA